jgi:hypothetical protein
MNKNANHIQAIPKLSISGIPPIVLCKISGEITYKNVANAEPIIEFIFGDLRVLNKKKAK